VEGLESCDDGDQDNGNGCNTDCRVSGTVQWQLLVNGPANGNDSGSDVVVDDEQNVHFNGLLIDTGNVPQRWQASVRPNKTPLGTSADNFTNNYVTRIHALARYENVLVDVGVRTSASSNDNIWVRQRDADGEMWTKSIDGIGLDDAGLGAAIDGAGNVIVVGYETNDAGRDASLIKLDSTGESIFHQTYNNADTFDDDAHAVTILSDDSFVVAGAVGVSLGNQDAWIARYTSGGALQWQRSFSGSSGVDDAALAVAVNADDEIFAAGLVGVDGDQESLLWLARLGPDGEPKWEITDEASNGSALASDLAIDSTGALVVVGAEYSESQGRDILVRKYTAAGQLMWKVARHSYDAEWDTANGVALDDNDAIYVAGTMVVPGHLSDIWLAKYNP